MDFVLEIFVETYLSLYEILVPEHKFKKWQETLLKLLCLLVSIIILVGMVGGVCLLIDGNKLLGTIFLAVASPLLAIQIVLFVITIVLEVKKEKRKKALKSSEENKENLLKCSEENNEKALNNPEENNENI